MFKIYEWKKYILSFIWGVLIITQIVLVFVAGMVNENRITFLVYLGWAIWGISILFGWLPIHTLKKKGGVAKGESYVKTTMLVEDGIYSIIRHPQYAAGILVSLALALVSQNWIVMALGAAGILLQYIDIVKADKYEVEKFGEEYTRYMKRVPRMNFILGIIRLIRRRTGRSENS
jgi:protein-S-isoprenylcysteine O-methyltransferase Ste14